MPDTLPTTHTETATLVEAIMQQQVNIAQKQIQASAIHGNVDPSEYDKLAHLYDLMGMRSETMPELSHRINTEAGEAASAAINRLHEGFDSIRHAQNRFDIYREDPTQQNLYKLYTAWEQRTNEGIYPAVIVNPPKGSYKEPVVYYSETTHLPLTLQLIDAGKLDEEINAYTIGFLVRVNVKGEEKLVLVLSVWSMVDTDHVKTQGQGKDTSPAVMVKVRQVISSSPLDLEPQRLEYRFVKDTRAYISPDDNDTNSPKYVIRTAPKEDAANARKQARRAVRRTGRDK